MITYQAPNISQEGVYTEDNQTVQSISSDVLFELAKLVGFKEKVPDIDTFIDDPFYLGKSLGNGIYPIWREAAREVFPSPYHSPYEEIILTGGIGLGKSTFSMLVLLYDLCRLMSLDNVTKHYSLLPNTIISYPLINATQSLANTVLWSMFESWTSNSDYFKSKLNKVNKKTIFQNNIDVVTASRGVQILGQATIGAIFSEINDMTIVAGQAEDNLDTFTTRRTSRFKNTKNEILGHIILDSSSRGNRSFIDARIEEKTRSGRKDFIVFKYAHWEAHAHEGRYSGKKFRVYAGDASLDPFIMDDSTAQESQEVNNNSDAIVKNLDPARIIDVPIELEEEFRINIVKSLRDLAGAATFSTTSFVTSSEIINSAFNRYNPTTKNLVLLDFNDRSQKLIDYIEVDNLVFLNKAPRFIHMDLGLVNDSLGIAASYLADYIKTERVDPLTGIKSIQTEPVFVTEWVLEIRSKVGQEVPIYKLKNLIVDLIYKRYPIAVVSTDSFQSSNLRQDLILEGVDARLISVDRTKDPYNLLRNLILEKRFTAPRVEKLVKEVRELHDTGSKWDHPSTNDGSKDILDAVCGSIWSCYQNISTLKTANEMETLGRALSQFAKNKPDKERFSNIILGR